MCGSNDGLSCGYEADCMMAEHKHHIGCHVAPPFQRDASEEVDMYVAEQEIGEWEIDGEVEMMGSINVEDEVEIGIVDE